MSLKFDLLIALSYLRVKGPEKIIALFSMLGIILGVATLIIVTSVMNGFHLELTKNIININGHINIYSRINDYEPIINQIKGYDDVQQVIPTISSQAMISSAGNNAGAMIRGISKSDLSKMDLIDKISNIEDFEQGIIIGARLAESLTVGIGDIVNIFSSKTVNTVLGSIPRMKSYKIIGIFELGMFEYDDLLVYMPIDMARTFFQYDDNTINSIDVYLSDVDNTLQLSTQISTELNLPNTTWQERGGYAEAIEMERRVMFIILVMIIMVASFNILSSLIMLVQNKKGAIAILRAIGATRGSIMRIFMLCGSLIGIIGTTFGVIIGVAFAYNIDTIKIFLEEYSGSSWFSPLISFFDKVPSVIIVGEIAKIIILSLSISLLATIIPALKAAKQDPAKILRGLY